MNPTLQIPVGAELKEVYKIQRNGTKLTKIQVGDVLYWQAKLLATTVEQVSPSVLGIEFDEDATQLAISVDGTVVDTINI